MPFYIPLVLAASVVANAAAAESAPLAVRVSDSLQRRVEITAADRVLIRSPEEGLWSIATGWKDGWPDAWRHAAVTRSLKAAEI